LDTCCGDNKGEIKEVYGLREGSELPSQFTLRIHRFFEGVPVLKINGRAGMVHLKS
jgi:hypothetical protein